MFINVFEFNRFDEQKVFIKFFKEMFSLDMTEPSVMGFGQRFDIEKPVVNSQAWEIVPTACSSNLIRNTNLLKVFALLVNIC